MDARNEKLRGGTQAVRILVVALLQSVLRFVLFPLRILFPVVAPVAQKLGPTFVHIAVLSSFLPFISFVSLGAGLVVRSWIPTGWRQVVYLQYGSDGSMPWAEVGIPEKVSASGAKYDLSIELVLPLFAKNADLGNFMTSLTLVTSTNQTLVHATRPSLIFPTPLLFKPLAATGLTPFSTQSVTIPLITAYTFGSYTKGARALIRVGREDGWRSVGDGRGREVVVVETYLRGHPKMSRIRAFFASHSVLLTLLTSGMFFALTSGATLIFYLVYAPALKLNPLSQQRLEQESNGHGGMKIEGPNDRDLRAALAQIDVKSEEEDINLGGEGPVSVGIDDGGDSDGY